MIRVYIIVGMVLALIGASGAAFHFYQVTSLTRQLADQKSATAIVEKDLIVSREDTQRAIGANTALQAAVTRMRADAEAAIREGAEIRKARADAEARVREVERRLDAPGRDDRLDVVRDRRASLLLERMNADVACRMENFARVGGRCVGGRWRVRVRD